MKIFTLLVFALLLSSCATHFAPLNKDGVKVTETDEKYYFSIQNASVRITYPDSTFQDRKKSFSIKKSAISKYFVVL